VHQHPLAETRLTLVVNGAHQRQVLLSATSGEGMDQWLTWLETQRCA
jgi:Ni2+-binding GTPase involved in maturation of urease and hydrogenase